MARGSSGRGWVGRGAEDGLEVTSLASLVGK